MNFTEILNSITTAGFPVVMCLIILKYWVEDKKTHKEETKEFTEALNKNTLVLQQLCDTLHQEV